MRSYYGCSSEKVNFTEIQELIRAAVTHQLPHVIPTSDKNKNKERNCLASRSNTHGLTKQIKFIRQDFKKTRYY